MLRLTFLLLLVLRSLKRSNIEQAMLHKYTRLAVFSRSSHVVTSHSFSGVLEGYRAIGRGGRGGTFQVCVGPVLTQHMRGWGGTFHCLRWGRVNTSNRLLPGAFVLELNTSGVWTILPEGCYIRRRLLSLGLHVTEELVLCCAL